jgi:hypothetical protein
MEEQEALTQALAGRYRIKREIGSDGKSAVFSPDDKTLRQPALQRGSDPWAV